MSPSTCHYLLDKFFTFKLPFFAIAPSTENTSHNGPVIIDITDNIELDQISRQMERLGYDVIYITSNIAESNGNNIIYFPSWLYSCSLQYSKFNRVNTTNKRNYKVSCLNRNCSPHKVYTYLQLVKRNYLDESIVSFSDSFCIDAKLTPLDLTTPPFTNELPIAVLEEAKAISLYREIESTWDNDHSFLHPAFTDCYLNITTETRAKYSLFTEKTAKTLAAGQLFLQVNGPRSLDGLKSLGIETFDSIIDSQYDTATDYISRIDKIFLLLDNIAPNLEELYHSNISAIQYNQEYFLSDSFRQRLEKNLQDRDLIV